MTKLAEHLAANGFVVIDKYHRPFYVDEQGKWLSFWHPDRYWVRQQEVDDHYIATLKPLALPADQAELYHRYHQRHWAALETGFKLLQPIFAPESGDPQ